MRERHDQRPDRLGQRIDPRPSRSPGRQGDGELRIEQRQRGPVLPVDDQVLAPRFGVGNHHPASDLRAGAGCRRDADERETGVGHLVEALKRADTTAVVSGHVDRLARIQRRSTTDAHDHVGLVVSEQLGAARDIAFGRLAGDRKRRGADRGGAERVLDLLGDPGLLHAGVSHHKGAPDAGVGLGDAYPGAGAETGPVQHSYRRIVRGQGWLRRRTHQTGSL